jgi:hypothetical protein
MQVAHFLQSDTVNIIRSFWIQSCAALWKCTSLYEVSAVFEERVLILRNAARCAPAAARLRSLPFDVAAEVWRTHPLATEAVDLSDLLSGWPEGAAPYAVASFTKGGHLNASVKSKTSMLRLAGATALKSMALVAASTFGWSHVLLAALKKLRCTARRLGVAVTGLTAQGMRMTIMADKQVGCANPLSPDVQLGHFMHLTDLDISGALVWRDSLPKTRPLYPLERLGASLAKLQRLVDVRLCNNNLTFHDMKLMGSWIEQGALRYVVHMDLSENGMICSLGAATLMTNVAALEHLVCLRMAHCNIGSDIARAHAEGMDRLHKRIQGSGQGKALRCRVANGRGTAVVTVSGGDTMELLLRGMAAVAGPSHPRFCCLDLSYNNMTEADWDMAFACAVDNLRPEGFVCMHVHASEVRPDGWRPSTRAACRQRLAILRSTRNACTTRQFDKCTCR